MPRTDRASRLVASDPASTYAALTDAAAIVAWLPPGEMTGAIEGFDASVGGGYRLTLTYPDATGAPGKTTPDTDVVDVRFLELDPGARVVYEARFVTDDPALQGAMTFTWDLTVTALGARVDLVVDDVPDAIDPADHEAGLDASLRQLDDYLAPGAPAVASSPVTDAEADPTAPAGAAPAYRVMSAEGVTFDLADASPMVHLMETEPPYRNISIPIALPEAQALELALTGRAGRRPGTHELTAALLARLRADVVAARIVRVEGGVYYAELDVMGPGGRVVVDCRTSDAIILALRQPVAAPILCAEAVMDEAAG